MRSVTLNCDECDDCGVVTANLGTPVSSSPFFSVETSTKDLRENGQSFIIEASDNNLRVADPRNGVISGVNNNMRVEGEQN